MPAFSPPRAARFAAAASAWAFEPKLDGWRVLVSVDGDLTVRTRHGHNVTGSMPELEPMAAALATFAQPPRHLHRNDQPEAITHWVSASMPWDAPDPSEAST